MLTRRNPRRRPSHPGALLSDLVLPPLGISKTRLGRALGLSRYQLSQILAEKRSVTPITAIVFAIALDSIPVAVITLAAVRRRRSSRPVGYTIGNIGFPFPGRERRENSIGGSPTGSLNPLGGGKVKLPHDLSGAPSSGLRSRTSGS